MQLFVLVTPMPEEALITTEDQSEAAWAWLEERVADGRFDMCEAFDETGGFVLLTLPTDDKAEALRLLAEMFDDYPLLPTIDMMVKFVTPTLRDGFDVLQTAQRRKVHTAEVVGQARGKTGLIMGTIRAVAARQRAQS